MDLLGHVGGPYATALVSASDGAQLWAQPMGPQEFFPTALALTGGDVAFKREFRSGSMRKVDVSRRLGANGNIVWTQRPGGPADAITGGVISTLPNGDLLLMARFIGDEADQAGLERPLLARMDIANGNLIWTQRPRAVGDRWRSVRAPPGLRSRPIHASSAAACGGASLATIGAPANIACTSQGGVAAAGPSCQ